MKRVSLPHEGVELVIVVPKNSGRHVSFLASLAHIQTIRDRLSHIFPLFTGPNHFAVTRTKTEDKEDGEDNEDDTTNTSPNQNPHRRSNRVHNIPL